MPVSVQTDEPPSLIGEVRRDGKEKRVKEQEVVADPAQYRIYFA